MLPERQSELTEGAIIAARSDSRRQLFFYLRFLHYEAALKNAVERAFSVDHDCTYDDSSSSDSDTNDCKCDVFAVKRRLRTAYPHIITKEFSLRYVNLLWDKQLKWLLRAFSPTKKELHYRRLLRRAVIRNAVGVIKVLVTYYQLSYREFGFYKNFVRAVEKGHLETLRYMYDMYRLYMSPTLHRRQGRLMLNAALSSDCSRQKKMLDWLMDIFYVDYDDCIWLMHRGYTVNHGCGCECGISHFNGCEYDFEERCYF